MSVPVHSIIPVLGNPTDPAANDGVVPLWSARVPAAASEVIIPGDRGAFASEKSLQELHRILRVHAGLDVEPDQY